jgi:hypothetical protein
MNRVTLESAAQYDGREAKCLDKMLINARLTNKIIRFHIKLAQKINRVWYIIMQLSHYPSFRCIKRTSEACFKQCLKIIKNLPLAMGLSEYINHHHVQ